MDTIGDQIVPSPSFWVMQSPELEFRHELMGRINKLESDVELDVVPINQHHPSSGSPPLSHHHHHQTGLVAGYGAQSYDHYGKEFFFGSKHRDALCSADGDDSFLRPPLWEDITSSIQNIDPENAIMLGTLSGGGVISAVPQVKTEAVDDAFLEPLSSPLLSPLEIKTEKSHQHSIQHHNNNNNSIHQNQLLSDSSCNNHTSSNSTFLTNSESSSYLHHSHPPPHPASGLATSHHGHGQQQQQQQHQQPQHHNLNGYMGCTNGLVSTQQHHPQQQQQQQHQQTSQHHPQGHHLQVNHNNNNYYHWPASHQPSGPTAQMYHPKYHPPQGSTICTPISRLMYVPPLTPPNSDPGSPGTTLQNPPNSSSSSCITTLVAVPW